MLTQDGDFILQESAGDLELEANEEWREQIVSERVVRYAGAKATPLHFREFYCPLHAASIQDADFVAHLTTMRVSTLCAHLGETPAESESVESDEPPGAANYLQSVLARIRNNRGSANPANAAPGTLVSGSDAGAFGEQANPEFRLLEAYFRFDVRGDGSPCRVFAMVAYDLDVAICWDYIANVTPEGRYPFEAVAMNKEPHRWHGRSWFKKYERYQRLIDKLLNQILYRNELAANPVKFRRKEAVVQWQDDQPFEIGPDKVFDLNDGYTAEDALQTASIPELDEQTKFLLEMAISNWQMRSGVSTVLSPGMGDTPLQQTATGVSHLADTGDLVFSPQIADVKRGLEAVLQQVVEYNMRFRIPTRRLWTASASRARWGRWSGSACGS